MIGEQCMIPYRGRGRKEKGREGEGGGEGEREREKRRGQDRERGRLGIDYDLCWMSHNLVCTHLRPQTLRSTSILTTSGVVGCLS